MGRLAIVAPALVIAAACASLAGAAATETIRSRLDPGWNDIGPTWAPDGTQILFGESYEPPKDVGDRRLALVRPDGSARRVLSRPPRDTWDIWDVGATFAPDGKQLLVTRELDTSDHLVLLKDVATGAETRLTPPADQETAGGWSPDGSRIVVVRSAGSPSSDTPYTERPDGTDARQVAPASPLVSARYLPGGTSIVLSRYSMGSWITVVPAAGGAERRLTPKGEWSFADAAPDGTRVLLVENAVEGNPALWIANVDGSGRRLLVRGADGGTWSPNGAWIAYTGGQFTNDHAVHLVHPDGSGARVLVPSGRDPAWSPDSRTVAYVDKGPCLNTGVYAIAAAAGGKPRRLTQDCRIVGTPRADVLLGTRTRDVIFGGGGDDVIRANPGDRPNVYFGEVDDDDVDGGPGNDTIIGGRGVDQLRGGPGNDRIFGGRGADHLVGGPGRDLLDGGPYHDHIDARDGERDIIRCGPGIDHVLADAIDVVAADCEHVVRS